MKRFLLFFVLLISSAFADAVSDKVRALVDPQSYVIHERLVEITFKNRKEFLAEPNRADSVKVAAALKEIGLLDLFYKDGHHNITATFRSVKSPLFFLKAVGDSLSELGYNFTRISAMRSDDLFFEWTLSYRSDRAIDPALLAKKLAAFRVTIDDISKQGDNWFFALNSKYPTLPEAKTLELTHTSEEPLTIQEPSGEYWVRLPPSGVKRVGVRKKTGGTWVVYAMFYDDGLQPIQSFVSQNAIRSVLTPSPENAVYLKITDNDVAVALQHGLQLWVETE
ncbi:MAG: hypothetical protein LBP89_04710 [Helicobacteraceae bacterium]|jgi:hypothetical protein|nr:hypothetical protein [Helicobacteraceae bacterium]